MLCLNITAQMHQLVTGGRPIIDKGIYFTAPHTNTAHQINRWSVMIGGIMLIRWTVEGLLQIRLTDDYWSSDEQMTTGHQMNRLLLDIRCTDSLWSSDEQITGTRWLEGGYYNCCDILKIVNHSDRTNVQIMKVWIDFRVTKANLLFNLCGIWILVLKTFGNCREACQANWAQS